MVTIPCFNDDECDDDCDDADDDPRSAGPPVDHPGASVPTR